MPDDDVTQTPEPAPAPTPVRGGKRRLMIFGAIILLNIGLLVLLLTQLLTPAFQAHADPLIEHPAPGFTLTLLSPQNGTRTLSLADFHGKPLVINFWASWCEPCKEEAPLLQNAWQQAHQQGKDVAFLGIDFQEAKGEALSFLQAYNITYPLILDTSGAVAGKYYIVSLPGTIFINRSGTVVSKVAQQITSQTLAHNLQLIES